MKTHTRINELENSIRKELIKIRERIRRGEDSKILIWIIAQKLACSQRPLRDHPIFGGRSPLPPQAKNIVKRWVE